MLFLFPTSWPGDRLLLLYTPINHYSKTILDVPELQDVKRLHFPLFSLYTIKGGSRRADKSDKVLMMMMKAAKLGWAGPGAG